MVVVVGCSHPGVDKIVDVATRIHSRIRMLVGGFHLVMADDPELARIIALLHDTYKVEYVAPGHCTGEVTFLQPSRRALETTPSMRDWALCLRSMPHRTR
jgi:7,8-dihydropterin-6-yl-methyl-4-(beta-D-ribofuranosyl)aminobenzene 5'-phosphate synthase